MFGQRQRILVALIAVLVVAHASSSIALKLRSKHRSGVMAGDQQLPAPNEKLPQMWELSTRPWLYSLSQKYGKPITKLAQIPMVEFQNIRNKGIDIVWLMGLWKLGTYLCVASSCACLGLLA